MKYFLQYIFIVQILLAASVSSQVLKPNSRLTISIKGIPVSEQAEVSGVYVVDERGRIKLPLLKQSIVVSGSTPTTVSRRVEAAYRSAKIYTQPTITIIDETFSSINDSNEKARFVTVGGEVRSSGQVNYTPGLTLYEAIQGAGGKTEFGTLRKVRLTRGRSTKVYNLNTPANRQIKLQKKDMIEVLSRGFFR